MSQSFMPQIYFISLKIAKRIIEIVSSAVLGWSNLTELVIVQNHIYFK